MFASQYPNSSEPLDRWYKLARKAQWHSLAEVRQDFPHADLIGRCTVFNIHGNAYRLVVKIDYWGQAIYIKHVLTHREYSREKWKNDC
jgi:mRNA interferase HigB